MVDVGQAIVDLFTLQFQLNFWTFILILAFLACLAGGYYLIATQVKLVKKEVWNWMDRLKCGVYAFFFADGVIIIIAMMVTFTTGSNYQYSGPFILIPLIFCLIYITLYPLIDLLYMARHKEPVALTPLQEIVENRFILKGKGVLSYVSAIGLYVITSILPPVLIMVLGGLDFIIVWVSWQLLWPMTILTYYGAKGYIAGLLGFYSRIPRLGRSGFLAYDQSHRFSQEIYKDPIARVGVILMLYLYVWTFISLVTTAMALDPNYILKSTMSYAFTVYIVLFFGIYGYFSRFWGRKIKFRTVDLLFAAFLIAAVGVNVLINFLLVNADKLAPAFMEWSITQTMYDVWTQNRAGQDVFNTRLFVPAAIIEETVLVILISFYFFERRHQFMSDTVYSEVTKAGDNFTPSAPFNLARSEDKKQRDHAWDVLRLMYDRVPLKVGFDILNPTFKDPLFDAVCDTNPYARTIGQELLSSLINNYPSKILPAIEEALVSPNYDKVRNTSEVVLTQGEKIIPLIRSDIGIQMLQQPDNQIRLYGIQLLQRINQYNICLTAEQLALIGNYVNDSNYDVQAEVLELLSKCAGQLPADVIFSKINHPNVRIKSAAANLIAKVDFKDLNEQALPFLLKMLSSSNVEMRSSVMMSLAKMGHFDERKIPIQPFLDGLVDQNESVRNASVEGLQSYLKENPQGLKIQPILDALKIKETNIQKSVLRVLGAVWKQIPDQIFPILVQSLRSSELELKESASKILVDMSVDNPTTIIGKLISEPETESFIRKGMISSTIIQIGNQAPQKVIPYLLTQMGESKPNVRENAIASLSELSEKYPKEIVLKSFITLWMQDIPAKIKKDIAKTVINVAMADPEKIRPYIPTLTKALSDPDKNLRRTVSKMFIDLAEKVPEIASVSSLKMLVQDTDATVRESGMHLIKVAGTRFPHESMQYLALGLKDKEWNVKNAAAEAFGELGSKLDSKEIVSDIKQMLSDPEKWTRLKALEVIQRIIDNKVTVLTLDEIIALLTRPDEDELFTINAVKILGSLGAEDFKKAFPVMVKFLNHSNPKVREGMISGMVKLANLIPIKTIIPNLLKYLSDETDMTLQQSVALLLKRIVRYESAEIKTRVISLLKIRCEMSQDSIICEVLSDLQKT